MVFPTETPPSYGGSPADPPGHNTAGVPENNLITPGYGIVTTNAESAKSSPTPTRTPTGGNSDASGTPITVIVQPNEVVIDDNTFTDNPTQMTSTVVLGGDTFVIEPSRVVGGGAIISRPPSNAGGVLIPTPTPTTTTVGGLGVVYGPSIATVDGTVFTLKPTPTVAVISGQTITLGPTEIVFPSQTLHVAAGPGPAQTAVMGGELITAIGTDKVVIKGTTITYGHDSSSTITTVVDGETILIGPTGVLIHNEIIGGATAAPTATKYEIVGGATVTQMGLTAVEISGITFHVGYGVSTAVTTVIDGHTLTIGPKGVGMSTWTLGAPYATTTTIMPGSSNNAAMTIPTATGSVENSGSIPRPYWIRGLVTAVGVGYVGQLLFWV